MKAKHVCTPQVVLSVQLVTEVIWLAVSSPCGDPNAGRHHHNRLLVTGGGSAKPGMSESVGDLVDASDGE